MLGGADYQRLPDMAAQAPTISFADMVDPAQDAGIESGIAYLAGVVSSEQRTQSIDGVYAMLGQAFMVSDANGQAVAYTYFRRDENEARQARVLHGTKPDGCGEHRQAARAARR